MYSSPLFQEDVDEYTIAKGKANMKLSSLDEGESEDFNVKITGTLKSRDGGKNDIKVIFSSVMFGGGDVKLTVEKEKAILTGYLGTQAYIKLKELTKNPKIRTLVLKDIPGSLNDEINMHIGRLIHEAGWTTYVPSNSYIESGGVDLFAAGVERIAESRAKIGIHAWCCFQNMPAETLPKEHPAHQYQIDYFTDMLGDEWGPKFYFRTLEAANFDGIHYMTAHEMKKYHLTTEIR